MIRELLDRMWYYLTGRSTLQELEVWALSNLQRILDSGDDTTIRIVNQLDADLVELGEGLISEATFREHLENYVSLRETIVFTFWEKEYPNITHATAAAETIKKRSEVLGPVVDLHLVHQFA